MACLNKTKVLKHTSAERETPMPVVLKIMREAPLVSAIDKFLIGDLKERERNKAKERPFYKAPGKVREALFDAKRFEEAVQLIAQRDLAPILDDVFARVEEHVAQDQNLKAHFQRLGVTGGKALTQNAMNLYSSLMASASSQVLVNSFDPNNMGWSELGYGQHKSKDEADAYVKHIQSFYEAFNIPVQDRVPEGEPAPDGSYPQGTLRHSITPVFWNLLEHPNVMKNKRLQHAILFWKAQIEMPLLDAQLKEGIFANADIVKTVKEGYHKGGFLPKGAQAKDGTGLYSTKGIENVKGPDRAFRAQWERVHEGMKDGWTAVDDFFNDNYIYTVESLRGVKQAQLLKILGNIEVPVIEYESPDLIAANAKDPSPHTFRINQHVTDKVIIEEAARMTALVGYEITPQRVLQEGGWTKANAHPGLSKWYRGAFDPPYLYKSVYNQVEAIFKQPVNFESLNDFAKLFRVATNWLTSLPFDILQFTSMTFAERPPMEVVKYITTFPLRTAFYIGKGIVSTGPAIWQGKYKNNVAKTEEELYWSKLFIQDGATGISGFKTFLKNVVDMNDRGIFPQRQSRKDNIMDYLMSFGGIGEALLGEMVAHDTLEVMIRIANQKVSEGMSVPDASKFTVQYINRATFNLHRSSWQGLTAEIMKYIFISRNFAVAPLSVLMITSRKTPLATPLKKAGLYDFKSDRGKVWNAISGADIPERFMDPMAEKMAGSIAKVLFWQVVIYATIQFALSFNDDDESDEHGEIGINTEAPKKRNFFNNPLPGTIRLGMRDRQGNPLFLSTPLFKMTDSMFDLMAAPVDTMGRFVTGNEDFDTGRGAYSFFTGKMGVAASVTELLFNRDSQTGDRFWDPNSKDYWQNVQRGMEAVKGNILTPINPWYAGGQERLPFSEDKLVDGMLKGLMLFGQNIKKGAPYDETMTSKEFDKLRDEVASKEFDDREARKSVRTIEDAEKALNDGTISVESYKNILKENANRIMYFRRRHRRDIMELDKD